MEKQFHSGKTLLKFLCMVCALLVVFVSHVEACPKDKPFRRLSRPEKIWTVFHPFKAKKVYECALRARVVTDSLEKAGVISDPDGGQLDAFRHAYWMALMVNAGMRENVVLNIGKRHERGNYIEFRQGKTEEGTRADSMMCEMDLSNNIRGIVIGTKFLSGDRKLSLIETILNEIWNGNLYIMSKNAAGDYLDKNGEVILLADYKDKWYIPKVIVKSDMIVVPH